MNKQLQKLVEPKNSVYVNASAGSGKTKILVDRVLRLILNNTDFSKILCITFTNHAASEIEGRVLSKMLEWSNLDLNHIRTELSDNLYFNPSQSELIKAKNLYLEYLNSQQRLNIQTIHSFCQKILSMIFVEANISPHMQIISDLQQLDIIKDIRKEMLIKFEIISKYLIQTLHETQIENLLLEILQKKHKIEKIVLTDLDVQFVIENKDSQLQTLQIEIELLLQDKILLKYINPTSEQLKNFFLKKNGEKKHLSQKKFTGDKEHLVMLQQKFLNINAKQNEISIIFHSKMLEIFSKNFLSCYEAKKKSLGVFDYEDLIYQAVQILNKPNVKELILFKLDGFIDHILVDEAQDTNPLQWEVIDCLAQESYSNSNCNTKSIFIVGDNKQSIFGFQGVNLAFYLEFINKLKIKYLQANYNFLSEELFVSYRSAKEINDFVYRVFSYINENLPLISLPISKIKTQTTFKGKIEIWPLYQSQKSKLTPWPIIKEDNLDHFVEPNLRKLAQDISLFIKEKLSNKYILRSQKRVVKENDFLILCRKRSKLTTVIQEEIAQAGIKISAFGKINLKKNLIAQDFISIVKFILNPFDDLNLAAILKSPLVQLTEQEIHKVILAKKDKTDFIWDVIKTHLSFRESPVYHLAIKIFDILRNIQQVYKKSDPKNIFLFIADTLNFRQIYNNSYDISYSNQIIDELIYLNIDYLRTNRKTLFEFVFWLETHDILLDVENCNNDSVRLMTIHSAKGLEAPIVILCDANTVPKQNMSIFFSGKELFFKNSVTKNSYQKINEIEKIDLLREYLRLLYVGITRAAEYLVICDVKNNINSKYSWFQLIINSIQKLEYKIVQEKIIIEP